jgi:hypothetical protein
VVTTILPGRRAFYADARTIRSGAARMIEVSAVELGRRYPKSFRKSCARLDNLLVDRASDRKGTPQLAIPCGIGKGPP